MYFAIIVGYVADGYLGFGLAVVVQRVGVERLAEGLAELAERVKVRFELALSHTLFCADCSRARAIASYRSVTSLGVWLS